MSLLNQHWQSFHGEPVTGRSHAQLIVHGTPLTPVQFGAVQSVYKLFTDACHLSIADFHSRTCALQDGTVVRMTSISGRDQVEVWTAGADLDQLMGYLVLPRDDYHLGGWGALPGGAAASPNALIGATAKLPVPLKLTLHAKQQAGAVTWFGAGGVVISYDHGGKNRYRTDLWDTVMDTTVVHPPATSGTGVYYKGVKINTPFGVDAACVYKQWLVVISSNTVLWTPSPLGRIEALLAGQGPQAGIPAGGISPSWDQLTPTGSVAAARAASAWHFSPNGSKAASAVVYSSYGLGSWTLKKMRTVALPQAKRYITLSDAGGVLQAVFSDAAFATEPFAIYSNGVMATYGYRGTQWGPIEPGSLTYTGKRLWGVDFAADGSEIEVICRMSGTGSIAINDPGDDSDGALSDTSGCAHSWGVYAGDQLIIEARTVIPALTYSQQDYMDQRVMSQTGGGLMEANYLAIHDLDARVLAASAERVRMSFDAALAFSERVLPNNLNPQLASVQLCAVDHTMEWVHNGSKVAEHTIDTPAAYRPNAYLDGQIPPAEIVTYGPMFIGQPGDGATAVFRIPPFPQVRGLNAENLYDEQSKNSALRQAPRHLSGYPNQVTDILLMSRGYYLPQISIWDFYLIWDDQSTGVNLAETRWLWNCYVPMSKTDDKLCGFASRGFGANHFIFATQGTHTRNFYDALLKTIAAYGGGSSAGHPYTHKAAAFYRDSPSAPFAQIDLLQAMADKVDAEAGAGAVDRSSFFLNPVRAV